VVIGQSTPVQQDNARRRQAYEDQEYIAVLAKVEPDWTLLGMARLTRWPKYSSSHRGWTWWMRLNTPGIVLPTRRPKWWRLRN